MQFGYSRKGLCLNQLYTVKLRPSAAMQLRTQRVVTIMNCKLLMISANETSLFVPFFIMCHFILFYRHRAVSLFKCYSVNMCDCHV